MRSPTRMRQIYDGGPPGKFRFPIKPWTVVFVAVIAFFWCTVSVCFRSGKMGMCRRASTRRLSSWRFTMHVIRPGLAV